MNEPPEEKDAEDPGVQGSTARADSRIHENPLPPLPGLPNNTSPVLDQPAAEARAFVHKPIAIRPPLLPPWDSAPHRPILLNGPPGQRPQDATTPETSLAQPKLQSLISSGHGSLNFSALEPIQLQNSSLTSWMADTNQSASRALEVPNPVSMIDPSDQNPPLTISTSIDTLQPSSQTPPQPVQSPATAPTSFDTSQRPSQLIIQPVPSSQAVPDAKPTSPTTQPKPSSPKASSTSGMKPISSYFSPSPKAPPEPPRSVQYPTTNILQQIQSSALLNTLNTSKDLPAASNRPPKLHLSPDKSLEPPQKRQRLENAIGGLHCANIAPELDLEANSIVPFLVRSPSVNAVPLNSMEKSDRSPDAVNKPPIPLPLTSTIQYTALPKAPTSTRLLHVPDPGVESAPSRPQTPTPKSPPISSPQPMRLTPQRADVVASSPPKPDVVDLTLSDDDGDEWCSSDTEPFDDYDPFFDTLETPKRRPVRSVIGGTDLDVKSLMPPQPLHLPGSALIALYNTYNIMNGKNPRKPYMTKRAREFLKHMGDYRELERFQDEILHVDFTPEEVELLKREREVPGRTNADCERFLQDHPMLELENDYPTFVQISASGTPQSTLDHKSNQTSSLRQRLCAELGLAQNRSPRELRKLLNLKPSSTFNHASGDVIDFKFHPITDQFAVCCNTLTNDYNRPGNLLFGDAKTEIVHQLNGHEDRTVGAEKYYTVSDICFSHDGQYLFSGSYDNTVKIWDMKGEMMSCLSGHGRITALSTTFCSDRVLAVASDDGHVYLYDVINPSKQRRIILEGQNNRLCPAFLVPGQGVCANWLLAGYEAKDSGSHAGALYAYDVPTGAMIQRIIPASNSQAAAFFHPSAMYFVVGATGPFSGAGPSAKSVVRVFDPRSDRIGMFVGHDSPQRDINVVTLSPCGLQVTSSGTDGKTFIWDLRMVGQGFEPLHILSHGPTKMVAPLDAQLEDWDTGVSVAEWLPQSNYLLTGGSDGMLKLWDTRLGSPLVRNVAEFDSGVSSMDFNADRDTLGVGQSSGRVTFLDWHGSGNPADELRKFRFQQVVAEGIGNEGILAARELLASGRVEIREHLGLRSVFAV